MQNVSYKFQFRKNTCYDMTNETFSITFNQCEGSQQNEGYTITCLVN